MVVIANAYDFIYVYVYTNIYMYIHTYISIIALCYLDVERLPVYVHDVALATVMCDYVCDGDCDFDCDYNMIICCIYV